MKRVIALIAIALSINCSSSTPSGPSGVGMGRWGPPSGYAVGRLAAPVPVAGRILDFSTNRGVAGARIEFGSLEFSSAVGVFTATAMALSEPDGTYMTTVPRFGSYVMFVDGVLRGTVQVAQDTRMDILHNTGTCVVRYGSVVDSLTLRPVAGATVLLQGVATVTGVDGWYRIDLGCPSNGLSGFNTNFIYVNHPNYAAASFVAGRGVFLASRYDLLVGGRARPPSN